ncbi:hypothetical protein NEDG_00286 [Nematocida displodere]|uniref:Uncharacterized protein n=1 Tax=Nematocida displodere TaxID=1805483 RepID=A0A177EK22_9MICR|nr:hypothetical protein NEDG_00286 [Nematocida displodere]
MKEDARVDARKENGAEARAQRPGEAGSEEPGSQEWPGGITAELTRTFAQVIATANAVVEGVGVRASIHGADTTTLYELTQKLSSASGTTKDYGYTLSLYVDELYQYVEETLRGVFDRFLGDLEKENPYEQSKKYAFQIVLKSKRDIEQSLIETFGVTSEIIYLKPRLFRERLYSYAQKHIPNHLK